MKKITTTKIVAVKRIYTIDGYIVEIERRYNEFMEDSIDLWVYKEEYGIKLYCIGVTVKQILDEYDDIDIFIRHFINNHLDSFISIYQDNYED